MTDRLPFTCPAVGVIISAPLGWRALSGPQLALPFAGTRRGMAIIDTGAERSVIRGDICDALGLPRSETVSLRGVTAPGRSPHDRDRLTTIRRAEVTIDGHSFAVDALAADVADDQAVMLIGMDIIRLGRLVIDGPRGELSLRFPEVEERRRRPQARAEPPQAHSFAVHRTRSGRPR